MLWIKKFKTSNAASETFPRTFGLASGLTLALVISLMPPPFGLQAASMRVGGIFLCAIVFWIFNVLPIYVTAFLMCLAWTGFARVEFSTVFVAFSRPTWWLVIGALGIGLSISKSGLLNRAALLSIRLFPRSYRGQILALLCTGAMISPLIPSTLAKMAIAGPMSVSIGETMGLKRREKPIAGLFCAAYVGYVLTGPVFISASFMSYIFLGVLPGGAAEQFTWVTWFLSMFPYGIVLLLGSLLFLSLWYAPDESVRISDTAIRARAEALGPLTGKEKKVLVILPAALILWMTEPVHHIPSAVVSMAALCLFIAVGVLKSGEFCTEMNWGMVFFCGCVVGASDVLSAAGIDVWLVSMIGSFLKIDGQHFPSFVVLLVLVLYLSRFLIAEMTTAMTLFTLLLAPLAAGAGINSWVIGVICYASVYTWNTVYQNSHFLVSFSSAGGEDVLRFSLTVPMSVAYMILNLAGLLACVPLWHFLGYLP